MRFLVLAVFLAITIVAGHSAEMTINLPAVADDVTAEHIAATYDCGESQMAVEYVNAGPVSLAIFAYDGEPVVASNVLSASGARYASGYLVWWTKGTQASLYDLRDGEDAPPVAECTEQR